MKTLIAILLLVSISMTAQDRQSDSLALLQIYDDMGGTEWTNVENWRSDMPLELWTGIIIGNDRVTGLSLRNKNIAGIFSEAIFDLTGLTSIDLTNGEIPHPIPARLTELTKLTWLILQDLGLTGTLPSDLHLLASVKTLSISSNNLSGPLPAALPAASTSINLGRNNLSGPIPNSWMGFTGTTLKLDANALSGDFDIIRTMPNISTIDLSDNDWEEAEFPLWIDDLSNLSWFACKNCNLSGQLSDELDFTALTNYSRMLIGGNNLSGDASLLFSGPTNIAEMYLSIRNNPFTGEFPTAAVLQASRIDLWGCNYTSIAPITEGVIIENFDLVANRLTYSSLLNVREHIVADSLIGISYQNQQDVLTPDTILITEPMTITIEAGEDLNGTTYVWYKNNQIIEGETTSELNIDITMNDLISTYYCRMTHPDYPYLQLQRASVRVITDLSTSTIESEPTRISLYPTITSDHLIIDNPRGIRIDRVQISALNGNHSSMLQLGADGIVDISQYPAGGYVLSIFSAGIVDQLKCIKL